MNLSLTTGEPPLVDVNVQDPPVKVSQLER